MSLEPTLKPGIKRGKKYRFTVKSAEEAIQIIRDRLGEEAKVLSVTQVDGKGLGKFLSSPKLEIVATIPTLTELIPDVRDKEKEEKPPVDFGVRSRESAEESSPERLFVKKQVNEARRRAEDIDEDLRATLREGMDEEKPARKKPQFPHSPFPYPEKKKANDIWDVLNKAGFADSLIRSIRYAMTDGRKLEDLPLSVGLAEVRQRLRIQYSEIDFKPITRRIAFLGTPGVGKTTAICKRLASDVFIHRKSIQVLKIDGDNPNPDEALATYCDVLGVPLLRDPNSDYGFDEFDCIYADSPGVVLNESTEWAFLEKQLDQLGIDTRVLVLNGAYEADFISQTIEAAQKVGATHLVLTHLDEVPNVTKLWQFVLRSQLSPFFVSCGQNITSDYEEDFETFLADKTFPNQLIH